MKRVLPAAAIKAGDHVRLDNEVMVISRVQNAWPNPGQILFTTSEGRAFGLGAGASVQVEGLS